jgi:hypothetical protein
MENAVFWDVTPCGSCKNRRFGGTCHHSDGGDTFLRNAGSYKSHIAEDGILQKVKIHENLVTCIIMMF